VRKALRGGSFKSTDDLRPPSKRSSPPTPCVIRLMLVATLCIVPSMSVADTITWTGAGLDPTDWNRPFNWDQERVPEAGDDVVLVAPFKEPAHVVEVREGDDPAECKTIMVSNASVSLIGNSLTLGEDSGPTTSTVTGQIYLRQGASQPATLYVRDWVEFSGTGKIEATLGQNNNYRPSIERLTADEDSGIKTSNAFDVVGHIHVGGLQRAQLPADVVLPVRRVAVGNGGVFRPNHPAGFAVANRDGLVAIVGDLHMALGQGALRCPDGNQNDGGCMSHAHVSPPEACRSASHSSPL
jgi:hypothetical protein